VQGSPAKEKMCQTYDPVMESGEFVERKNASGVQRYPSIEDIAEARPKGMSKLIYLKE